MNTANPSNYFNFLMDRGQRTEDGSQSIELNQEAKKLIHYFFLGLTLPSESFWVNLKPQEPERITSVELSKTDLGRTLLEQDLKLKKDMANYLHPHNPQGKLYWERLYAAIGKDKAKKATITSSNRVWIVPAEAVVLETEDGALVAKATLKVLLESEYLSLKEKRWNKEVEAKSEVRDEIKHISESLMKEIILPALTKEINESPGYAPLRQVYHSLILAEWFKRKNLKTEKLKNEKTNPYAQYINSGITKGLESALPWEKQAIWQEYLRSYQEGEYKLQDTIFGLKRMYFSGGIAFFGESGIGVSGGSPIITKKLLEPPRNNPGEILATATGTEPGNTKIKIITVNEKEPKAPGLPDKDLTSSIRSQSQPGASKTEIAASPVSGSAWKEEVLGKSLFEDHLKDLKAELDKIQEEEFKEEMKKMTREMNAIMAKANKLKQEEQPSETRYKSMKNFDYYEKGRSLVREANKKIVEDVFNRFIPKDADILEIGSGIGELSRLIPEGYSITESDRNREYLDYGYDKRSPKRVVADVYQLPFTSNSFRAVVGYAVLDVLPYLTPAFEEINRVLANGGRIVHFLDMVPDPDIIMEDYKDFMLFPYFEDNMPKGFQAVSREKFKVGMIKADYKYAPVIYAYYNDPKTTFNSLIQNNDLEIMKSISHEIQSLPIKKEIIVPMDYFKKKVESSLAQTGFRIEESEYITHKVIIKRDKRGPFKSQYNVIESRLGFARPLYDPSLSSQIKSDEVMVISTMYVFSAVKEDKKTEDGSNLPDVGIAASPAVQSASSAMDTQQEIEPSIFLNTNQITQEDLYNINFARVLTTYFTNRFNRMFLPKLFELCAEYDLQVKNDVQLIELRKRLEPDRLRTLSASSKEFQSLISFARELDRRYQEREVNFFDVKYVFEPSQRTDFFIRPDEIEFFKNQGVSKIRYILLNDMSHLVIVTMPSGEWLYRKIEGVIDNGLLDRRIEECRKFYPEIRYSNNGKSVRFLVRYIKGHKLSFREQERYKAFVGLPSWFPYFDTRGRHNFIMNEQGKVFYVDQDLLENMVLNLNPDSSQIGYANNEDSSLRGQSLSETGGIDLSQIKLTLKDDKYISTLNPADLKILRAAKALKEEWNSLSLLYIHELMLLLKDNLASNVQNKNLLFQVLQQLQIQKFLDPQAIQFLNLIQANKPLSEVRLAMY